MKTFVFIDASNLLRRTKKSWLENRLSKTPYLFARKIQNNRNFYFGGVELHDFEYEYQNNDTVPIKKLEKHLVDFIKNKGKNWMKPLLFL